MPPLVHDLILVTQAGGGFDLSPIIGSGPIGAILALFIFMYREKDKKSEQSLVEKDKSFVEVLAEKDKSFIAVLSLKDRQIEALQNKIDAMQASQIDRQSAHIDRYHAALTAMTDATRSLSEEVAHATETIR